MGGFLFGVMFGMFATAALEIAAAYYFVRNSKASVAHILHACALALAKPRPKEPEKLPEVEVKTEVNRSALVLPQPAPRKGRLI